MVDRNTWIAERDAFLKSPPPRQIPPLVLSASATTLPIGFGIVLHSLIFCFGIFMSWTFGGQHRLDEWRLQKDPSQQAEGRILSVKKDQSVPERKPDYQYTFTYPVSDRQSLQGTAYTTWKKWKEGDVVQVDYLLKNPSVASVQGAQMDEFGSGCYFVLLAPAFAITMAWLGIHSHKTRLRILKDGIATDVRVKWIEKSMWKQENKVFAYDVALIDIETQEKLARHTFSPIEGKYLVQKMKDQKPVTILHTPNAGKRILVPEAWTPTFVNNL